MSQPTDVKIISDILEKEGFEVLSIEIPEEGLDAGIEISGKEKGGRLINYYIQIDLYNYPDIFVVNEFIYDEDDYGMRFVAETDELKKAIEILKPLCL